jgi:hypothetical protein
MDYAPPRPDDGHGEANWFRCGWEKAHWLTHAMRPLDLPGAVTVDSISASFQRQLVTAQHVVHVCQDFAEGKSRLVLIEFALENARDEFRD